MTQQQQKAAAARERAVQVFRHYVRVLFDKAGASASYTGDTDAEIEGIVDDILEAAREGARAETKRLLEASRTTDHARAVGDLQRRARDKEGPVERMTNEGSIGTGPDRNRASDELRLKDGSTPATD